MSGIWNQQQEHSNLLIHSGDSSHYILVFSLAEWPNIIRMNGTRKREVCVGDSKTRIITDARESWLSSIQCVDCWKIIPRNLTEPNIFAAPNRFHSFRSYGEIRENSIATANSGYRVAAVVFNWLFHTQSLCVRIYSSHTRPVEVDIACAYTTLWRMMLEHNRIWSGNLSCADNTRRIARYEMNALPILIICIHSSVAASFWSQFLNRFVIISSTNLL